VTLHSSAVPQTKLFFRSGFAGAYRGYRSDLGRAMLLGFLVAADIISTVAIRPRLNDVLILGQSCSFARS